MEGLGRHRPVPLGHEDVRGQPLVALQAAQRAYLVALHRVDTRRAVLRPADVQPPGGQLNLAANDANSQPFSSRFSSLKKRQSVPCAMILLGADLIIPAS